MTTDRRRRGAEKGREKPLEEAESNSGECNAAVKSERIPGAERGRREMGSFISKKAIKSR